MELVRCVNGGRVGGRKDGRTDGRVKRGRDGWMDGRTEG